MAEEIEFETAREVTARRVKKKWPEYVCPKGHRRNTTFAIYDPAGEAQAQEQFCMVCFVEWVRANVPKVERIEE